MRKERLLIFAIAFTGALTGANVQPILTGAGKLLFPEASPSASISASSGAITVAAGGTNQNIKLTPSGSGLTSMAGAGTGTALVGTSAFGANYSGLSFDGSLATGSYHLIGSPSDTNLYINRQTGGFISFRENNAEQMQVASGGVVKIAGNLGTGGATGSFAVDATGDINVSGVFRKGGTAGVGSGSTVTVCSTVAAGPPASCSSSCTLQFTGGIRTGGTCP